MRHNNFLLIGVLFFAELLLINPATAANQLDPLSPEELSNIQNVTGNLSPQRSQRSIVSSKSATFTPGLELLMIERRPTDKDAPNKRLADIYQYDYNSDETIHTIFDLAQQNVVSSKRQQYLQLPLTENEINRATQIIFTDSEQRALLNREYQRITGQILRSPEQLKTKAFVFSADTLPESLNQASQECGLYRCAQILIYTAESVVFEISPIVNLSAGLVTQNIGY